MERCDAVVIGAGPAGLGAAIELARAGAKTVLMDENDRPGGQLFKQIHKFFGSREHYAGMRGYDIGKKLLREADEAQVDVRLHTRVWSIDPEYIVYAQKDGSRMEVHSDAVILAVGACENTLAFPGCTLPGVMMAGAAQTMMNLYRTLPGKDILMVGSGNVGLIVSYQLLQAGADVRLLIDAASQTAGYEVHAAKIRRAGVPIRLGYTIIEAHGEESVQSVVIGKVDEHFHLIEGTQEEIPVDTICVAVGMSPRIELASLAGCRLGWSPVLGGQVPLHHSHMETSAPGIFVAGDAAGTEEASTALDQGRMAGTAAALYLHFLNERQYLSCVKNIDDRLNRLRAGQFGEKRRLAEEKIWEAL